MFSDFLNRNAMVQMLTLYSRHFNHKKDEWESIVAHVFTKNKNPKADYEMGIKIIKNEFAEREIPLRKMVKFTDNCAAENKSKFVLADSKTDEDFVAIFKTPGSFLFIFHVMGHII